MYVSRVEDQKNHSTLADFPSSKDKFVGDFGMRSFAMIHRFLCTTTGSSSASNEATKQAADSKEASEGDSGKGEESNDSNKSSEQGRAVRGGGYSFTSTN